MGSLDFINRKLEEKIGLDLNGDGQIGGPGLKSQLEQSTHIDLNRDGVIGYRPPANGGKHRPFSSPPFHVYPSSFRSRRQNRGRNAHRSER